MKKIYFAGSIRGGRNDLELYIKIINYLKKFGKVLTEHIGEASLTSFGEKNTSDKTIHDRDMAWLLTCDIVVAEVTTPSLGVGYEIGRAIEHNKKIICFYREINDNRVSAMILGSKDINCEKYKDFESFKELIHKYL